VARIAAAAIRLARAPEQHRPLEAVRDLSAPPSRPMPRRSQPVGRPHARGEARWQGPGQSRHTERRSIQLGDRPRRPRSREAVQAARVDSDPMKE
jgi:hypothetical protein